MKTLVDCKPTHDAAVEFRGGLCRRSGRPLQRAPQGHRGPGCAPLSLGGSPQPRMAVRPLDTATAHRAPWYPGWTSRAPGGPSRDTFVLSPSHCRRHLRRLQTALEARFGAYALDKASLIPELSPWSRMPRLAPPGSIL